MEGVELNREFRRALELLEGSGRHVLVTGRAGTGKSTLLRYFLQTTRKRAVVLAPTGVAAVNVGGQTIHSFFGFRPDVTPDRVGRVLVPGKDSVYARLEVLVIDEVSMVRADLLDCVDRFLRLNGPRRHQPFGGVQMAFFGDLYQLPPVVTGSERRALEAVYDTPYFYSAKAFQGLEVELVELEKVYRQQDAEFLELLGAIRNGTVTDEHLHRLNRRVQPGFEPGPGQLYVQLTATNRLAEAVNRDHLSRLRGRPYVFFGLLEGEFAGDHAPAPLRLEVKVGAQVMMVSNDPRGRWVNGTMGRVAAVPVPEGDEPVVVVELEDGTQVEVTPHTWELFSFSVEGGELRSRVVGQYTQLPMTLAWAVTIHKSQGKTFDRVVIDLGRGAFAPGQVYVALSRCRTLEGIVLRRPVERKHVWVDYRIVKFLTRFQYERAERAMSVQARRALLEQAAREGRPLEIVYLKPNGDRSRRVVRPLRVEEVEYRGHTFLGLRAFCGRRQEERTFRVDRILEVADHGPGASDPG